MAKPFCSPKTWQFMLWCHYVNDICCLACISTHSPEQEHCCEAPTEPEQQQAALRQLIDMRKRARRAGQPVPLLGYPQDPPLLRAPDRASAETPVPAGLPASSAKTRVVESSSIISSSSESGDSDSGQEDLGDEEAGAGGHANLRSRMAGRAAAAAKMATAAAASALTRGKGLRAGNKMLLC